MKKFFSVFLCVAMLFSMNTAAFADENVENIEENISEIVNTAESADTVELTDIVEPADAVEPIDTDDEIIPTEENASDEEIPDKTESEKSDEITEINESSVMLMFESGAEVEYSTDGSAYRRRRKHSSDS